MSTSSVKLSPSQIIQDLLSLAKVQDALVFFQKQAEAITEEHIRICSIPASPFGEQERAEYLRAKFIEIGLQDVSLDGEGNCVAMCKGDTLSPLMVVSAHLDTVFPQNTDFTIKKSDQRLLAPGISDDGCGLAALIAIAQVLVVKQLRPSGSILFVGTVGEEGEGNLRGVRHLFTGGE